jgi:hypothetical protein
VVGYFFRTERITHFINAVSEIHLGGWWELCIRLITPITLLVCLGSGLLDEITGRLYGSADWPAWMVLVGPGLLAAFFVVAFLLARRWHLIGITAAAIAIGLVLRFAVGLGLGASLLAAMATVVFFGGLAVCLAIARRGKDVEHHERTHGWPEEERLHHPAPGDEDK